MKAEVEMTLPHESGTLAFPAYLNNIDGAEFSNAKMFSQGGFLHVGFEIEAPGIDGPDVVADALIEVFAEVGTEWKTMTIRTAGATLYLQPSNLNRGEA